MQQLVGGDAQSAIYDGFWAPCKDSFGLPKVQIETQQECHLFRCTFGTHVHNDDQHGVQRVFTVRQLFNSETHVTPVGATHGVAGSSAAKT